jgi:biotin transport system substrate-specific component
MTYPGAVARPVIADRVVPRSFASDAVLVLAGAAFVGLLAQVSVPMFPVPITGQTLGVLLVGAALGMRRGAASLGLYLLVGLAGLPVFADFTGGPLSVLKPSFGFVIGFIAAAAFVGWAAERRFDRRFLSLLLVALGGTVIPFLFGLPYLALMLPVYDLPNDPASVLAVGVTPFLVGGVVKALIAAAALPLAWRGVAALDRRAGRDPR